MNENYIIIISIEYRFVYESMIIFLLLSIGKIIAALPVFELKRLSHKFIF